MLDRNGTTKNIGSVRILVPIPTRLHYYCMTRLVPFIMGVV